MWGWVLITVLLLAGTGEAGESFQFTNGDGSIVVSCANVKACDEFLQHKNMKELKLDHACYQRMQEAMRRMDERIALIYHEPSFRGGASLRDAMGVQHMTHWQQTMRECVK